MTAIIYQGDARSLPLPDASIDAIVTDPPYSLSFMGREWDSHDSPQAFQVWCGEWAAEALRVLKPGGHLLAFGGTRTWHRMVCAVEDAGFEIRDTITWLYGQGFPKSFDVSKSIDKAGGESPREQAVVLRAARERAGLSREDLASAVGCSVHSVDTWEDGRSPARGKPVEFLTPSEPFRLRLAELLGYTADERVITGTVVNRTDAPTVYGLGHTGTRFGLPVTSAAKRWAGWGTALKPGSEPIVVARKMPAGTVTENVLTHGTGALNIDACRVGDGGHLKWSSPRGMGSVHSFADDAWTQAQGRPFAEATSSPVGRWPTNVVLDEFAAEALDGQSGVLVSGANPVRRSSDKFRSAYGEFKGQEQCEPARGQDVGGASRFFPVFRYEAKASDAERPVVDGVEHETVKPLSLMRWLVRLVTPPGGLILDQFAGSGTTVEAAMLEGFDVVGVEREPTYLPLIRARVDRATRRSQPGIAALATAKVKPQLDGQLDLFADLGGVA